MQIIQHTFGGNSNEPTFKLMMYFHLRFERVYKNPEQTLSYGKISYILSGTGEYTQGDVTVPMKKGDLLIINPYTPHIESSSENDPIEHLYFCFNSSVFDDKQPNKHNTFYSDDDMPQNNIRIYDFSEYHSAFTELKDMFAREIQQKKPYYETKLQYAFHMLIIEILRKTELSRSPLPPVSLNKSMRIPVAVVQYLKSYHTAPLSLDKISERFYVSKTYLTYIFKKTYGMTVMEYLNNNLYEAKLVYYASPPRINTPISALSYKSELFLSDGKFTAFPLYIAHTGQCHAVRLYGTSSSLKQTTNPVCTSFLSTSRYVFT